jgi:hypothetical protein
MPNATATIPLSWVGVEAVHRLSEAFTGRAISAMASRARRRRGIISLHFRGVPVKQIHPKKAGLARRGGKSAWQECLRHVG